MRWQQIVLISMFTANALVSVAKPTAGATPGKTSILVAVQGLLIWMVASL